MEGMPILKVVGKTIPEAWERSVLEVMRAGVEMPTEYDRPGDPPSRDCTMVIEVVDPTEEPMIHRSMPCSLDDLNHYVEDVCLGASDYNIGNGGQYYTYHSRMRQYAIMGECVDQYAGACWELARARHTRRAQIVTWVVGEDNDHSDPPCLQSLWFRLNKGAQKWWLSMNVRMRSNDAYRAAFMNMYAFVAVQRKMAAELQLIMKEPVGVGRYCHLADSYHVYGCTIEDCEKRLISSINARTFEDRTWHSAVLRGEVEA